MLHIGNRKIGPGSPLFVVAEVAQAHDGSLGTAHAYIDAAAAAGADAVKFQTHIAAEESTPAEPWRVRFSPQDETRYAYWKRMEFTADQWQGLHDHAREKGLLFLSSPFSCAAVDLLERIGVPAWKVGSGEITTPDILDAMAATGKPVLLSNGMSTWREMDRAVDRIRSRGLPFGIYQCTSAYPCPPEDVGLNVLDELRRRYDCPVGLSDHSGTMFAGLAACALGADMLEVHVAFSRQCFGPDVPASLTLEELAELVRGARFIERALAHPVDKDRMAEKLSPLRAMFRKSVVARRALPAGHRLDRADIVCKKPGGGVPAEQAEALIGRSLKRDILADEMILEKDVA